MLRSVQNSMYIAVCGLRCFSTSQPTNAYDTIMCNHYQSYISAEKSLHLLESTLIPYLRQCKDAIYLKPTFGIQHYCAHILNQTITKGGDISSMTDFRSELLAPVDTTAVRPIIFPSKHLTAFTHRTLWLALGMSSVSKVPSNDADLLTITSSIDAHDTNIKTIPRLPLLQWSLPGLFQDLDLVYESWRTSQRSEYDICRYFETSAVWKEADNGSIMPNKIKPALALLKGDTTSLLPKEFMNWCIQLNVAMLDAYWWSFFATNNDEYVRRIVEVAGLFMPYYTEENFEKLFSEEWGTSSIDDAKPATTRKEQQERMKRKLSEVAMWSLFGNVQEHERVVTIVEKIGDETGIVGGALGGLSVGSTGAPASPEQRIVKELIARQTPVGMDNKNTLSSLAAVTLANELRVTLRDVFNDRHTQDDDK